MYVPLYKRVWFWVMVALLTGAVGILKWQMIARAADEETVIRNAVQQAYFDIMTKRGEDMVARQKADTYGGDTPEETLRLFVEALEKKDYELASKYYVVEEQDDFKKDLSNTKGFDEFKSSYYSQPKIIPVLLGSSGKYEIEIESKNTGAPYRVRFVKNEYINKWKLTEK